MGCAGGDGGDLAASAQVQGEYVGALDFSESPMTMGAQIIALGSGEFDLALLAGGLPGDGASERVRVVRGALDGAEAVFDTDMWTVRVGDGAARFAAPDGRDLGVLTRVVRRSPTLDAPPPAGAIALFDGTSTDAFAGSVDVAEDGALVAGATTVQSFGDFFLHLEFRTPLMPDECGQARGNSGVYLQDRYEIQVLDSFALAAGDRECGAIYGVRAPDAPDASGTSASLPPQTWQTYDVAFVAARFDASGAKIADARVTAYHNGALIHDDVALPSATSGGVSTEFPGVGPLRLQDHGDPVHYRNLWIVEQPDATAAAVGLD